MQIIQEYKMSTSTPSFTSIVRDLYLHRPQNGLLASAVNYLDKQDPFSAISSVLSALGLRYYFTGEFHTTLKFSCDPLSWGVWINGPTPLRKRTIYLCTENETQELCVISRTDLVTVVRLVVLKADDLTTRQGGVLRRVPAQDEDLIAELYRGKHVLQHPRFQDAQRAIERDCLLDACVEFFKPFGLQPRMYIPKDTDEKWREKSPVVFNGKWLWNHKEKGPVVWIERVDRYIDTKAVDEPIVRGYNAKDIEDEHMRVQLRRCLQTCVVVQSTSLTTDPPQGTDTTRTLKTILGAVGLVGQLNKHKDNENLCHGVVYNLQHHNECIMLVLCLLHLRNDLRCDDRKSQDFQRWLGKMEGWDTAHRNTLSKAEVKRQMCLARVCGLRNAITPDEDVVMGGTEEGGFVVDEDYDVVMEDSEGELEGGVALEKLFRDS